MGRLPQGCALGVTYANWYGNTIISTVSQSFEDPDGLHSDVNLTGSFCPGLSGLYTLSFEGTYDEEYEHYYYFSDLRGNIPKKETMYLMKNRCYPFNVLNAGVKKASSQMTVTLNQMSYVPTVTKLISCQFTGCINGGNINNMCKLSQTRPNYCHPKNKLLLLL